MLPFLFTTLKRRLGTEDTKWWSVSGVILSHSSCKQVLRWATVRGLRCRIFALQNVPHILYWRQVGTAGRPVKYPYPLPPQPGLCNVCRMWFCIVLLKYAWTSLEKMSSWRQHIVLQNLYVLFSINGAITEVQVTFAKGTDTTPYHDRPWLLDLLLVTVWMILFFFGPEHTASIPPKKYLKYWFIWPQYTFPLCDGPSQMPPSPEKSTALLDTVNIGLPFGTVQF